MFRNVLGNVDEYLSKLVGEACTHGRGSKGRQAKLKEVIRVVMKSDYLWRENKPYYEDALQQTWLYLCENPERYDLASGTVLNWLNKYLKWRLKDFSRANWKVEARKVAVQRARAEKMYDFIEVNDEETWDLAARPDIPLILEETRKWVEADSSGELRKTHVRDRPDVTCQILILLRLPPEVRWSTIASKFNLAKSTAPDFYNREAMPRLREFGVRQGYLE